MTSKSRNLFDTLPSSQPATQINVVAVAIFLVVAGAGLVATLQTNNPYWVVAGVLLGFAAAQSPRVAQQWERAVVLRLGRFIGLQGPGLFWIVPFVDAVGRVIDQRVITTSFAAEQTLTSDTVPVNVDAVLFWMVYDAEKAALEVQDYPSTVSLAAQTALRDIIGRTSLADLLRGRDKIEEQLQKLIDERSTPWGVTVQSVEMRDIVIPSQLQEAMSREAQATREKAARIILGEAEMEIARSFEIASRVYIDNPTALHLRAMNMLYEGLKEKGALMLVPEHGGGVDGHGRHAWRGPRCSRHASPAAAARPNERRPSTPSSPPVCWRRRSKRSKPAPTGGTAATPAFEVASIRPNRTVGVPQRFQAAAGGRYTFTAYTLKSLIDVSHQRSAFDNREMVGGRLGPVYALTLARADRRLGAGLKPTGTDCAEAMRKLVAPLPGAAPSRDAPPCTFGGAPGRTIGNNVSLAMLASVLSSNVGRPVIDRTGVAGYFDFTLDYTPDVGVRGLDRPPHRRGPRLPLVMRRRSSPRYRNSSD
jgi:regulator of protease activity HflC (stomatin/prohibitin superfamily)